MKYVLVAGIVLTIVGVVLGLFSFRLNTRVMGKAGLGVGIIAPEKGSKEWLEKEQLRKRSDGLFYWGVIIAVAGGVVQVIWTLLSP